MGFIAYLILGIIGLLLLAIAVYFIWFNWQTRPRRLKEDGYRYIFVEDDGSAREITINERHFFEIELSPFDGSRPYVKIRYESLNGYGGLSGFLPRRQLPKGIPIEQLSSEAESYEENELFGEIDGSKMVEARKKLSEIFNENLDDS